MKIFYKAIILCILFSGFEACNLINKEEPIPSYIRIDSISINTVFATQGSNSSNISDAWIFVNDISIGTFQLPCLVPVLDQGKNARVSVQAGIRINGIGALRFPYPFYRFYVTETTLTPDSITIVKPETGYYEDVNFAYRANFDDPSGITLEPTSNSDTSIAVVSNPNMVYEGNGSAYAILTRDSSLMFFQSTVVMNLPKNGRTIYLEMDYKVNDLLQVGVIARSIGSTLVKPAITLNPTTKWNKIYINLTESVSSVPEAIDYRLFFYAQKISPQASLELFLDNIKVVYIN